MNHVQINDLIGQSNEYREAGCDAQAAQCASEALDALADLSYSEVIEGLQPTVYSVYEALRHDPSFDADTGDPVQD